MVENLFGLVTMPIYCLIPLTFVFLMPIVTGYDHACDIDQVARFQSLFAEYKGYLSDSLCIRIEFHRIRVNEQRNHAVFQ